MAEIAYFESARGGNRLSAEAARGGELAALDSLYVRYDMDSLKKTAQRDGPAKYAAESAGSLGMWRYRDVLPEVEPVTLSEGWTPMLQSKRYAGLFIKEEGANPTGSCEARGLSMAVSMAKRNGVKHLAMATEGDAAGALAAYSAAAGIEAHLYIPQDRHLANYLECVVHGADVHPADGPVSECVRLLGEEIEAQKAAELSLSERWFDLSALEPFRVEGAKTMGYELAEQLGWTYPEAVIYPASGVGVIAMWKAFEEMEALGWIAAGSKRPRMYAAGCDAATLEIVRASGGKVMAADEEEILASLLDWAKHEGILLSLEGGAATVAYDRLIAEGALKTPDRVVLFNTGAGLKYAERTAEAMKLRRPGSLPTSLPVGGIITPV